jgi:hypothetical protein
MFYVSLRFVGLGCDLKSFGRVGLGLLMGW